MTSVLRPMRAPRARVNSGNGAPAAAPRLNKVIALIEAGQTAFGCFVPSGSIPDAVWASRSAYDFVVFEQEHDALDLVGLRTSLQHLLDRRRIYEAAQQGRIGPDVVPFVRVPRNGGERDDWLIKQVLDLGVYGIVFPMVETAEDVRHILGAMRFPEARGGESGGPPGRRGYSPQNAERYWGVEGDDYYERADAWPLDPHGELLPILQCETVKGIENLPALLDEVPHPGLILISTGDLSASMGLRGAYTPEVEQLVQHAVAVCRAREVPFGTPHGMPENIEARVKEGFSFLMCGPRRDVSTLQRGRAKAGR